MRVPHAAHLCRPARWAGGAASSLAQSYIPQRENTMSKPVLGCVAAIALLVAACSSGTSTGCGPGLM
jgi:hypothetical protein